MTRTPTRALALLSAAALTTGALGAPAKVTPAGATPAGTARAGQESRAVTPFDLPRELEAAGWTTELVTRLSSFQDIDAQSFERVDPVAYPMIQPAFHPWSGIGVRPVSPKGEIVYPEAPNTRGFAQLALWPRAEVLYRYSDDIIDIFLDPPDDPDANDLNALSVIPNSTFVFLYINAITEQRVQYLAYDEEIHAGQGYLLIEVNGPEGGCFNVTEFGYQANPDGQLFNHCTWADFGSIVSQMAGVMGLLREHQRSDRDTYIEVFEENIGPPELFGGIGPAEFEPITFFGAKIGDYDYGSITHYSEFQSSLNGLKTITLNFEPALAWLNENPDVVGNLVALFPDRLDQLDPDFDTELVDVLGEVVGTGAGLSTGDVRTLWTLYGNPGEPIPWIFDPTSTCPADVDKDGRMTAQDLRLFLQLLNSRSIFTDLNGDGDFTNTDFQIFYAAWRPGFCQVPGLPDPPDGRPVVGTNPG